MISIKSKREIEIIREASEILVYIFSQLKKFIEPGISTIDIDKKAASLIREKGAQAAFKGYRGFPANICTSINEEVVHGIPSARRLEEGDILSIDIGVKYKGYYSDCARTWPIGNVSKEAERLISVTRDALLEAGLKNIRAGAKLGETSHAIQKFVEGNGFSVVRDFVGHGIGREIHEEPQVPNFGSPTKGPKLEKGMVLAIEPMVNSGTWEVEILDNNWTVVTCDRKLSAHYEDVIVVTEDGAEVLTL